MKARILTSIERFTYVLAFPILFLFLGSSTFAQLSGTKYIGGTTPDYTSIKAAIQDLNTQGTAAPGVTFLIRDGIYVEDSLRISTTTSNASAPVIFKPDAGAAVVINVTPPNTSYNFAVKIEATQYVTFDGSNTVNGMSRDMTINSLGASGQRGFWVSSTSHYTTIKNCNINAGYDIASPSASVIGVDFRYISGTGNDPDYVICRNNHIKYAYTGIRMEGVAGGDFMEGAHVELNVIDSVCNAGIYSHYEHNTLINNNDINVLRGSSSTIYGLYVGSASSVVQVYSNKVHDINQLSTTSAVYGIYVSSSTTYGVNSVFNNFIWNINPPATGTGGVYGLYSGTANTSTPDIITFNTVYLSGTSGGDRLSYAFYKGSSSGPSNSYNNIFINTRTDGAAGIAFSTGKTTAATVLSSDNNDLYVGTVDAQHQTGRIATTNYALIGDWRTANISDAVSFVENAPFISETDLHIQSTVPSQLESGGIPVSGILADIDSEIRSTTTPDVGADEFTGIPLDLTAPVISYTPLTNTPSTASRTLYAEITDLSGVPTAGVGLPVLYWNINDGAYTGVQAVYVSGTQYSFTFGEGVVINDVVKYYIAAQDLASTPNVGVYPSNGAGGFTSNPPAASTPPTNPDSYIIVDQPLSGDYTVGLTLFNRVTGRELMLQKMTHRVVKEVPVQESADLIQGKKGIENQADEMTIWGKSGTKTIKTEVTEEYYALMDGDQVYRGPSYIYLTPEESKLYGLDGVRGVYPTVLAAVEDLNLRGVAGPVRFLLNDAEFNESAPVVIDISSENLPTSSNTITFKPNTGVNSTITVNSASPVFITYNSYITIDGSNVENGTSRNLTIKNIGAGGLTFFSSASDITIKNTIGYANTSTAPYGYIFNNISNGYAENNLVYKASLAIQAQAASSNIVISGNILGSDVTADQLGRYGIVLIGTDGFEISGNTVFGIIVSTSGANYGILLGYNSTSGGGAINGTVSGNIVHDIINTNTSGYGAYGITVSTGGPANDDIFNNIIYNILGTGDNIGTTAWIYNPFGIVITNLSTAVNIYYNSIHLYGAGPTYSSPTGSAGLIVDVNCSGINFKDNVIKNEMTGTGAYKAFGIYLKPTVSPFTEINYNDYFVNSTNPSFIGYFNGEDTTLAQWQTAVGQDGNTISMDPLFMSDTDMRPQENSPLLNAGTAISGITTDFLGVNRNASTPSIGAYEEAVYIPLSGIYTIGLSAFNQATGKNVYFETRTNRVRMDLSKPDSWLDINPAPDKDGKNSNRSTKFSEVNKTSKILMENGKPFNRDFFKTMDSRGIYPTITEAVNDLNLRGINGPVTFLLVDSDYPNETYPIAIGEVSGASSTNTITFKPGDGIITQIPGAIDQPTSTFQLAGADYVTIDGSNTAGGTTRDLTINSLNSSPAFHFYGASDYNVVKNTVFSSLNTSTGSGTFLFGASASGDFNLINNCVIKDNDTSTVKPAVGVYFFSSNLSNGNTIQGCEDYNFTDRGMTLQGSPSTNNNIIGNHIYHLLPSAKTSIYGIYIGRQYGLNINGNYISDLMTTGSSPTVTGIYIIGSSTNPVDVYIRNNVVSLSSSNELTSGTLRGLDYYGYPANSVEMYFNTVFIGGIDITGGTTAGISKRDAATTFKAYDNAVYNTRSNGSGTGIHYGIYLTNTEATAFELNNNDYYTDGTGGILGRFGTTDYTTLPDWQTATTQDANSISNNPQFVSNLDYRPATGSPLLGAGLTIAGITTDILGDLRNEPPTIGAYENSVASLPAAPSDLAAVGDTNVVYLQWADNSSNETGFVVERRLGDTTSVNPFEVIDTTAADAEDYIDYNVEPLTTYTYRLYAYNSNGTSPYSNIAQATTPVPVELTSFTAKVGDNSVELNWTTATEINNSGFEIQKKAADKWEKVTFIKGKGTTTEKSNYSFTEDFKYQSVTGVIVYRLKQVDLNGAFSYSNQLNVTVDFTPKDYTLYQNYPNPFNPSTKIKFALPFDSRVKISVYNILGELIDVILDEVRSTGYHDIPWNGVNMSSGMYIYTIQAKSVDGKKDFSSVKKMMLIK